MRDPDRIPEILGVLNQLWSKDPDLRFNQLLYNLQSQFAGENEGRGRIKEAREDGSARVGFDLFSLEDEEFLRFLRSKV
ncbi:MAG: hypothetical protein AB8H86_16855 [Polyangiales bacterium]